LFRTYSEKRMLNQTVLLAIKDQNPELYRDLKTSGQLTSFVNQTAGDLTAEIHDRMMADYPKWTGLPYMERVKRLTVARSRAQEIVLSEMLDFRPGETSLPSQDGTTASDQET
jgi:hypothetical protein